MMGFQEFLFIVALVLAIIFIPRRLAVRHAKQPVRPKINLSGRTRMAIAASAVYLAGVAAYFQPWRKDQLLFMYTGIGPIALGWLLHWVFVGFRRR